MLSLKVHRNGQSLTQDDIYLVSKFDLRSKSNYHHKIIRKFMENSAWHMARELKIQPIANDKLKPENHKMNELGNKSYPI